MSTRLRTVFLFAAAIGFVHTSHSTSLPDAFSLEDVIGIVLKRSPSINAVRSSAESAEHLLQAARWQRFPSLSLQADSRVSGSGFYPNSNNQFGSTARIDLPIYTFGRISADIDAASERQRSADLSIHESAEEIASQVAAIWRDVLSAHLTIQADHLSLARLDEFSGKIRRRIEAGVAPPVDHLIAQSRRLQIESDLAVAHSNLRVSLTRLEVLTGRPISESDLNRMAPVRVQLDDARSHNVLSTLNESNLEAASYKLPAYLRASADANAALHDYSSSRARLLPEVLARYQYQSGGSGVAPSEGIFISLNYQFGSGLAAWSNSAAAAARLNSARDKAEIALEAARQTLMVGWRDYSEAYRRLHVAEQAIHQSREVLAVNLRLFDAGRRSIFELLTSQLELAQAERSIAPLHAQIIHASYMLRLRLGLLPWQSTPKRFEP